jgi:LSD1 subclass zinc finger protein
MPEINPKSLTCPTCGAPLNYDGKSTSVRCTFCQNVVVLETPKPDMEFKAWLDTPVKTPLPDEILELLRAGNKIEAIKRYREVYDVSAAKAKYAIERIEAGNLQDPEFGFQTPKAEKPKPVPKRRRWPWSRR